MKTYTIGLANEDTEINLQVLHNILKGSEIHATFINDTFFRLKDGTVIRMSNEDINRYKVELRDHNLDNLL